MLHRVIGFVILAAAVAMGSTPLYQSKFSKANTDWTALRGESTAGEDIRVEWVDSHGKPRGKRHGPDVDRVGCGADDGIDAV